MSPYFSLLICLFLALQRVSGCGALLQFILLMMPVLGSPECMWLWCLAAIYLVDDACPWPSRMCVAVVSYCNSNLLIMLSLVRQMVSGFSALLQL